MLEEISYVHLCLKFVSSFVYCSLFLAEWAISTCVHEAENVGEQTNARLADQVVEWNVELDDFADVLGLFLVAIFIWVDRCFVFKVLFHELHRIPLLRHRVPDDACTNVDSQSKYGCFASHV